MITDRSDEKILPLLLRDRAAADPDLPFLQHVDEPHLTFAEAHLAGLRWASAYKAAGISRGDTVVTMLPVSTKAIQSWLGLAWLGAIDVSINTDLRGDLLRHCLDNADASILLVDASYWPQFAAVPDILELYSRIIVVGAGDRAEQDFGPNAVSDDGFIAPFHAQVDIEEIVASSEMLRADDVATIIYTSGTTGPSKGVMVPWLQLHETARYFTPTDGFRKGEGYYSPLPMYHMAGKLAVVMMARSSGRLVLRAGFRTQDFWQDVRTYECAGTLLLGAMATWLERQPAAESDADNPLRYAVVVPTPSDVPGFLKRFGMESIRVMFNMTETAVPIFSDIRSQTAACGRLRDEYDARLVDADGREVSDGQPGELLLRPKEPGILFAGYWRMPEETVRAWRDLWFHTGDALQRDSEGNFYYVDRVKDALRRRGENISSFEVESVINQLPEVFESAVVAVPSEFGEDDVKAVVVLRAGAVFDPERFRSRLQEEMPKFMLPRYVEIVAALPKTPTEKVRKQQLRDLGLTATTWDYDRSGLASVSGSEKVASEQTPTDETGGVDV